MRPDLNGPRYIRLGERFVEYRFARRRRRTLGITVDAQGVAVAAPMHAPMRTVESFLREREGWILSKLEHWERAPRPQVVHVESGATLPLFGELVALEVKEGRRAVRRQDSRLLVSAPGPLRATQALVAWLKEAALSSLGPRTEHFAAQLGLPAPRLALSNARTQWGACTARGRIRLNWRLVHLERPLADYVVAHEVAHLVEMNHSRRFWALLGRLYPAWREAREQLELAGASIPTIKEAR